MLFQQPVLYPHLSVAQNIGLGASKARKNTNGNHLPLRSSKPLACRALKKDALPNFPGVRHNVAFGRALLQRPELILLDEPFASVDVKRRLGLAEMTRDHLKHRNIAALHVTHDIEEARVLSDRMVHWSDLVTESAEDEGDGGKRLARD